MSGGPTSAPLGNHRARSVHEAPRHLMVLFNAFNLYNLIFFFQVGKIIYIYTFTNHYIVKFHQRLIFDQNCTLLVHITTMKYQVTNIETTNVALSMLYQRYNVRRNTVITRREHSFRRLFREKGHKIEGKGKSRGGGLDGGS